MEANELWAIWQELVLQCAPGCTTPGRRHFLEWITGLALNVEEHTITQSLIGLGRPQDWKGAETFAEYGYWDQDYLERATARLLETAPGRLWHGYHVWAGDDTKVHRCSKHVWGTCTFHEYSARCPNRASTVRAHNWVVVGALLANPDGPAWFVPHSGRLYFRRSQLPFQQGDSGPREPFRTKCDLLVDQLRPVAETLGGLHLVVVDGAFALASVVRPLRCPQVGQPRIDLVTRLRSDARLYAPLSPPRPGQRGRPRKWGRRLPPPRCGGQWPGPWHQGQVFLYGRIRKVRWKEILCQWHVAGHAVMVKAVVAEVEGYKKRFTLVTSAVELIGLQVVELFCARFREEDGFRDLKQRLGWEECRAWTKQPIVRTTQALFVVLLVLRLLQFRVQAAAGDDWWLHPPWNRRKTRPSVLDVERLLWQHRQAFQQLLAAQLEEGKKPGQVLLGR
jgi:DDE superfamily endonuclease